MNLRLPILSLAFGLSLPTAFAYPPWIRPAYEGLIRYEQNYVFRINNPDYFHSIGGRSVGLPSRYFPENKPEFKLLTVELPVDEALIYGFDEIPAELKVTRGGKSYVKFLIHPESRDLYIDLIKKYGAKEEYTATSLSSYRSLVIWKADQPGSELMVKLSLNRKIGGVVRNLEGEWIQRANGASALVHTINPETLEQMGIGMIDEPASITPSEINGGMQIRRWPTDSPAKRRLIPMFSLGATTPVNTRLSQASPLLEEYIKRSGLSAQQFIEKHIIAPVTRQLAYLAVEEGIVLEPHAQNILMEFDENGLPTGKFWYRDFGGFSVDPGLRKAAGKDFSFLPKNLTPESLKPYSPDGILGSLEKYFVDGNMYGLTRSLETQHPSINVDWMRTTYSKHMHAALAARLGTPSASGRVTELAFNRRSNNGKADSARLLCTAKTMDQPRP